MHGQRNGAQARSRKHHHRITLVEPAGGSEKFRLARMVETHAGQFALGDRCGDDCTRLSAKCQPGRLLQRMQGKARAAFVRLACAKRRILQPEHRQRAVEDLCCIFRLGDPLDRHRKAA